MSLETFDLATRRVLENYFDVDLDAGTGAASMRGDLLTELELVQLAGGDWLFHQDTPGDSLYLLVRGRLQVWREGDDPDASTFLGEILPGASVGEVGLLTGERRSAGIRAIRDSLLVRIDHDSFERLAAHHPALVLRLAGNVARMLHASNSKQRADRRPRTLSLRRLDDSTRGDAFCDALVAALRAHGSVLDLSPERLPALGAPAAAPVDAPIDEALRHWISEQEDHHRFVLFRVPPGYSHWSRYAERQSDLVLHIAAADGDPALRDFEDAPLASAPARAGNRLALVLLHGAGAAIGGTRRWLEPRRPDFHLHVRDGREDDLARVARVVAGRAQGLVLGGGAARGFAHLGVYRALVEQEMAIDWVGGTSIGAIMGAAIALDIGPEIATQRARDAFVVGKPFADYTLPLLSVLRGSRMTSLSKDLLRGDIEDLPIPFFCVSSNINTGLVNVHESGPIWRATNASAALPGVLPPMVHEGELAVDGAVLNNLPVDIMESKPVGVVFAVELSSRAEHRVAYEDVPSPWAVLRGRLVPSATRHSVPGIATMLLKSTEVATRARVLEMGARADILFRPPVHRFPMMSVAHFDETVDVGRAHAQEQILAWRDRNQEPPAA
ncbi:MAG TPA: cyclic nucleotide-binding and patatin-like phospholipase domain-containing protein [Pseudomonadales bacterium]|nr:cyclic nucleotide-binding and patatin-like phospholipase domain-containing protein [Pseudomonadales bacterium]